MTFLVCLLLLECLILLVGIVIAASIVLQAIKVLDETKKYAEEKKVELTSFINEKQAFVQDIENRIKNSRIGSLLGF